MYKKVFLVPQLLHTIHSKHYSHTYKELTQYKSTVIQQTYTILIKRYITCPSGKRSLQRIWSPH